LIVPQSLYESVSTWLEEKLALQEKLTPTDDPALLVADLEAKAKQLTDVQVDLIMKSMKKPYKSKRPTKPKSSSKSKKPKKTASANVAEESFGGKPFFNVGPDDEMPSEEEILSWLETQKGEEQAKKIKQLKDEFKAEQAAKQESEGEKGTEEPVIKHGEL
jgi:hypoxia up-regulated 1